MTRRVALFHSLTQRFDRRVQLSTHWLRVRPAPHARARLEAYSLRVATQPHFVNWLRDPFENYLARLDLPEPVDHLTMTVEFVATLEPVNPFDFLVEPHAARYPFSYDAQLRKELAPYLSLPAAGALWREFSAQLDRREGYIVEHLGRVTRQVHERVSVAAPLSACPGVVDIEGVLASRSGTAWDCAWLLTLSLRALGMAARFTCGYRIFLSENPLELPDDAGLHAWSEVFLPGAGWVGLDPAAGLFTNEAYVPLASAPDPLRTLPWVGYREPCEEQVTTQFRVQRLEPRASDEPLGGAQWNDINAVGRHVDADLRAQGLALATGTSLCFVSSYAAAAPEWTTAALGQGKRALGEALLLRLRERLAPGGVIHVGQGEWFAGEPLPRWRLVCFGRSDGRPVWRDEGLLAATSMPARGAGMDVEQFACDLARRLGIAPQFVTPAYEDNLQQLWVNRRHGMVAAPLGQLRDPQRRQALAAALSAGASEHFEPLSNAEGRSPSAFQQTASGYVLPLRWDWERGGWTSGAWALRRGRLYLAAGQSPLGYRLPLESLPVGDAATLEPDPERCQFDARPPLADVHGELSARYSTVAAGGPPWEVADAPADGPGGAPRTALCVELRDGRLYVFMPPLSHLEHYLALLAAVEAAAASCNVAVLLEGYEPPEDHRLRRWVIEPDAGMLRVRLPLVGAWPELCVQVSALYEEAAALGLVGERIAGDGRRFAPGGGAPICLGAERPEQSPLLRRPELLRSLISYWQRHPSLSYFFAGRFVGPDCAAPRPDEGREDALYELGLGLERMPRGESVAPWMPDRLLRHLLANGAGDIRNAEIRIDELYGPDRAGQRLGRAEVRSFETPPHSRLALLQVLLMKTLVAYFGHFPVTGGARPWGEALHDRFMLPDVLWQDLQAVLEELRAAGYPLQAHWFEPLRKLRFPSLGCVQMQDIVLELNTAHEPWPVLAEEVTAAGVARFVDYAAERVQVRVSGLTPSRYVLSCNGRRVPLQALATRGEYVAGVRYKVWNPPATLHPTIAAVHSLVFDLIDTWTGTIVGGCTYFPPRPGEWGPTGTPAMAAEAIAEGEGQASSARRRNAGPSIPPWTTGGYFHPRGSDARYAAAPPEEPRSRFPYLLDLMS
jgi:uncharacterized protein (DUF2126 family)/transglutaminase-like putative cysteine protease